jgi:hypothetical protein
VAPLRPEDRRRNTFTIERRANTPIEANVFYSKAAMDTALHVRMLGEFEKLLVEA